MTDFENTHLTKRRKWEGPVSAQLIRSGRVSERQLWGNSRRPTGGPPLGLSWRRASAARLSPYPVVRLLIDVAAVIAWLTPPVQTL
jgi:hypothetical protein